MLYRKLTAAFTLTCLTACTQSPAESQKTEASPPNIMIIYMDDLGIGDLGVYNPNSKIPTPNIDQFARESVVFTAAHSPSAVCSPSRYGLLTGRYAWRSWLKAGVVGGYSPSMIRDGEQTLAAWLQERDYETAMIGKWHLGFGSAEPDLTKFATGFTDTPVSFETPPDIGPNTLGFDYFYGLSASLDFPPYAYLENGAYVVAPTEFTEERRDGEYLDGLFYWREGEIAEGFEFEDVEPHLISKVVEYIDGHASSDSDRPFFLYYASPAPHTPVLPTGEHVGISAAGEYGDFVAQTDTSFGVIMDALDRNGLKENTLVVFSSDNGAVNFSNLAPFDHIPNAPFRGQKSELYDGGHRVPFIVGWPKAIESGVSDQFVIQTDLFRTVTDILDGSIEPSQAGDSFSFSSTLNADFIASTAARSSGVHHSLFGTFAFREGDWKLLLDDQSGGYGASYDALPAYWTLSIDPSKFRLYNVAEDPAETNDLSETYPERVAEMTAKLRAIRAQDSSISADQ